MRRSRKDYDLLMTFGSCETDEAGHIHLSDTGRQRCYRTAEAFFDRRFHRRKESLLIAGGHPKKLIDNPPAEREALLMADLLITQCDVPSSAIITETRSTSSIENFTCSMEEYLELFQGVINGEERIGLVSHPLHLARLAFIGTELLPCSADQLIKLPTMQRDGRNNDEKAAFAATKIQVAAIKATKYLLDIQSPSLKEAA